MDQSKEQEVNDKKEEEEQQQHITTTTTSTNKDEKTEENSNNDKNDNNETEKVNTADDMTKMMMDACQSNDLKTISNLLSTNHNHHNIASQQELHHGKSPLMIAASIGSLPACQLLLNAGAPWNALDKYGKCAGDYAVENEHWDVVNALVDAGVKAEFILGAAATASSSKKQQQQQHEDEESSTKPSYLSHHCNLQYISNNKALIDDDGDAIMMEWERPLMKAHAQILLSQQKQEQKKSGLSIMNIGFGMGIIDSIIQEHEYKPYRHVIVEAHPIIYQQMIQNQWDKKDNVEIWFGRWQDLLLPDKKMKKNEEKFDAIFFDTYAEHAIDLQEFQEKVVTQYLSKPNGIYSFFNGLAPDNLFFHGVACECIKLQLAKVGLDVEFATCQMEQVNNNIDNNDTWKDIKRKYWHGRDTYYLPIVTWNKEFLKQQQCD